MATIMKALGCSNDETITEVLGGEKGETIAKVIEDTGFTPADEVSIPPTTTDNGK